MQITAFTSSCYARPEPTQLESNVTQDETLECNSCRDVVGFTRRLFDTSDIDELKTNLTKWCVESGNGATDQVVSHYICMKMRHVVYSTFVIQSLMS